MVQTTRSHVLAINNEAAVLDLFRDLLVDEGYRVTTQAYAVKDLNAIVTLAPNLIILDYMWAEEDGGWSLLQMLRMDPRTAAIPVVLCTGARRQVEDLSAHLRELGVRVVLKPFNIDALLVAVRESLAGGADKTGEPNRP